MTTGVDRISYLHIASIFEVYNNVSLWEKRIFYFFLVNYRIEISIIFSETLIFTEIEKNQQHETGITKFVGHSKSGPTNPQKPISFHYMTVKNDRFFQSVQRYIFLLDRQIFCAEKVISYLLFNQVNSLSFLVYSLTEFLHSFLFKK